MALTRILDEQDVAPDLRRLYEEIRVAFDVPFVPTLLMQLAAEPEYLKVLWDDLRRVVRSVEFQTATKALQEFADSVVVESGFRFTDQQRVLAAQKFSASDAELLHTLAVVFSRSLWQMVLFSRLLERGYSGGQQGRVRDSHQASALSRLMRLNVPGEHEAGLRTWLIYSDIRRVTNSRHVPSAFRVLSPYPSYLASLWMETKKLMSEPGFLRARDEIHKRVQGLLVGIPVRDHRAQGKRISPAVWRDIEQAVDTYARSVPQYAIVGTVWRRSFTQFPNRSLAA